MDFKRILMEPKASNTDDRFRWILLTATFAILLILSISFLVGRCSTPELIILPDGVDAGPGEAEIAARLDAAVVAEDERLEALEEEHAAEVLAIAEADRAEYEETRARGRNALAMWFKERTRRIIDAGVTR